MADDSPDAPIEVTTGDGVTLEARLAVPAAATSGVVLLHPHPRMGGDLHSPMTDWLARELPARGVATLRPNLRGVGRSGGTHDGGRAERWDVAAAVDRLAGEVGGPVWIAGWSFGADVSLQVADEQVAGWVLVAPVLRIVAPEHRVAAADARTKLLLVPEHDRFAPPEAVRRETRDWVAATVEVLPGADHFLAGALGRITDSIHSVVVRPE